MALFGTILWIVGILCAAWVIIDVLKQKKLSSGKKAIWIVAAVILSILTAIVYYFVEKRK